MSKKILIISSEYTGRGHKSITDAICEQLSKMDNIEVSVLEGFSMIGKVGIKFSKFYGPLTRNSKKAWAMTWKFVQHNTDTINKTIKTLISKKFAEFVEEEKPDVVVSVHPAFIGCILNVMKKKNIKIPFVSIYADLVSISNMWTDPRADYSICYTQEAVDYSLKMGIPMEKIKKMSFPVRERFTYGNPVSGSQIFKSHEIPTFLIMSGGEGSGNLIELSRMLLDNFNCRVKVLTGRNEKLRKKFEKQEKGKYAERLDVHGFVEAIEELMLSSDLAFMRGSPNTILEAINCCLPVIITDALPGQEAGNPKYFEENMLGCFAHDLKDIKETVKNLLDNNAKKLMEIKKHQAKFRNPNAAKEIAEFIVSLTEKKNEEI